MAPPTAQAEHGWVGRASRRYRPGRDPDQLDSPPSCPDDLARRTGSQPTDETHLAETTEAVGAALQQMPADVRHVCQRRMDGTVTSVARDLGLSRRQVRNRLRKVRPHLEHAGEEF